MKIDAGKTAEYVCKNLLVDYAVKGKELSPYGYHAGARVRFGLTSGESVVLPRAWLSSYVGTR